MTALTRAIIEQVRVEIHYHPRGNVAPVTRELKQGNPRMLSPVQVELYRNNWYLLAWCHMQNGYRYFALKRVTDVCQLSVPATLLACVSALSARSG